MIRQTFAVALAALVVAGALAGAGTHAGAQAYDPGPQGIVTGSSMSGARIVGAPKRHTGIPNADIFGDEVEERVYGRDYDNSYLTPKIGVSRPEKTTEELAVEGRADLNGISAGTYARQGPRAIGASTVTRGSSKGRAPIVYTKPAAR